MASLHAPHADGSTTCWLGGRTLTGIVSAQGAAGYDPRCFLIIHGTLGIKSRGHWPVAIQPSHNVIEIRVGVGR